MRTPLPKLPKKQPLSIEENRRIRELPEIKLSQIDKEYFSKKLNNEKARYEYDQSRISRQLKKARDIK